MSTQSVKMLIPMVCEKNDRNVGDIVEVDSAEAARLIEKGFAEAADGTSSKGKKAKASSQGGE